MMLSKWKHSYSCLKLGIQMCSRSCRNDYCNFYRGIASVAEPLTANDSCGVVERPDLPDWVTVSCNNTTVTKSDDDDFVPPSMSSYWIENHKCHEQDVDMKRIVNDVIESDVDKISGILKKQFNSPDLIVEALNVCDVDLSKSLVEKILKRFSFDCVPALQFFKWSELRNEIAHPPDLYNLMADNLGKARKFDLMWELVEEMKTLGGYVTSHTMSIVTRRLTKAGKYEDALVTFRTMELFGIERDTTSMNFLMDALVKEGSVEHAEGLFLEFKEVIPPTSRTYNILVHGWCKSGQICKATSTVDEMKAFGCSPDTITYTCFIEAHCLKKDFRKVDSVLEQMRKDGLSPNVVTCTIIMKALAKAKDMNKAFEIYEKMKQNNCPPDPAFYSVFINALSASGRLKDSVAVFEDMSKKGVVPDVLAYNSLIIAATKNLQEEKALKLLQKMEGSGCKPDLKTYTPLLKMFCKLKRMKVLSFLLSHMFRNDVGIDLGTYSLLVTRLCSNGKLEQACSFFEESVIKGFVPMDCTYKKLVEKLEKEGMHKERQRIEELMSSVKQQVNSSATLTETRLNPTDHQNSLESQ